MPRLPDFEFPGEIFLPGSKQLGHDFGLLRREPILQFIQSLDG